MKKTARAEVLEEEEGEFIWRCGEATEPLDEERMQEMITTWQQGQISISTLTRLQNVRQEKRRTCVPHLHDVSTWWEQWTHKAEKIPVIDRDEENLTKENMSTRKIKREWRQGKSFDYYWSL